MMFKKGRKYFSVFFHNLFSQSNIIEKTKTKAKKWFKKSFQNLSEEGKNKKREYGRERYKNLSEDEKQKLVEYRKMHYKKAKK